MSYTTHTITLTIDGVDRTDILRSQTLKFSAAIEGGVPTLDFELTDKSNSLVLSGWEEVVLTVDTGTADETVVFGGYLIKPGKKRITTTGVYWKLQARGYGMRLSKSIPISRTYTGETCGSIVADIFTQAGLSDFDTSTRVSAGPTLEKFTVRWRESLIDAVSRLAKYAGNYVWFIDPEKKLYFGPRTANYAPFGMTDDSSLFGIYEEIVGGTLEVSPDASVVVSKVKVIGGQQAKGPVTETFTDADGVSNADGSITIKLSRGDVSSFSNIMVDGTDYTNLTGFDYVDSFSSSINVLTDKVAGTLRFDSGIIVSGSSISISYYYLDDVMEEVEDSAFYAAHGFHLTAQPVVVPSITDPNQAQTYGQKLLDASSTVLNGRFATFSFGILPGHYVYIKSSLYGLDDYYLAERVTLTINRSKQHIRTDVEFGGRTGTLTKRIQDAQGSGLSRLPAYMPPTAYTLEGEVGTARIRDKLIMGSVQGYMNGEGVFLGKDGGLYKLHIGDPAGDYMSYDGAGNLHITGVFSGATDLDGTQANDWLINSDRDTSGSTLTFGGSGGDAVLTWDGSTLGLDKDFAIATNKFTVATLNGNTTMAGSLNVGNSITVQGAADFQDEFGISGDFFVATDKFYISSATGNTTIAGTLSVDNISEKTSGAHITLGSDVKTDSSDQNVHFGIKALKSVSSGIGLTAIGYAALKFNTDGDYNTAVGESALLLNSSGNRNTGVGYYTLVNSKGSNNTAIGYQSLYALTTGTYNVAIGSQTLSKITTSSHNIGFGYRAGYYISDGSTENKTSGTSVYLGANTKANADGDTNEIVIGYNAIGAGSNTVTLGNTSITFTQLRGDVDVPSTLTVGDVGSDLIPELTDTYDLGTSTKLWRKGWLSELESILFVENSVQVTGGWWMVPHQSGTLAEDVDATQTTIDFGTAVTPNDFIIMRGNLSVEYLQVGTLVSGTTYNVTRDLDGTGANSWPKGQVWADLGYDGDGRIEFDAQTGGPRISVLSQGTSYNAQTEYVRIGDLDDTYGYTSETYGVGIGAYGIADYITVDATDGIRFFDSSGVQQAQLSGGVWTLGETSSDHIQLDYGGFQLLYGGTTYTSLYSGVLTLGDEGEEHVIVDTSGVSLYDGATMYGRFAATTTIGDISGGEYVSVASTGVSLYGGGTERTHLASDGSGWLAGDGKLNWDTSGNITMTGTITTSNITADGGTVGGWTLTSTYIKNGSMKLGSTGRLVAGTGDDVVIIDADTSTYRLWAGNSVATSAPFSVTKAGALSATSGTIGGWYIGSSWLGSTSSNEIKLDASNKKIGINSSTFGNKGIQLDYNSGTPRFYAGDGSNYYFNFDGTNLSWKGKYTELTTAGAFSASSATISGTITSSSGTIGGFTLSSGALTSSSGDMKIDSANDRIYWGSGYLYKTVTGIFLKDGDLGVDDGIYTYGNLSVSGNALIGGNLNHNDSTAQIAFFGASLASKTGSTNDIKDTLVTYGLVTDGGATPLNLDGGALTAGSATFTGTLSANGGGKLGNADTDTVAVYGATAIARQSHIAHATGISDVVARLNDVIDAIQNFGITKTS